MNWLLVLSTLLGSHLSEMCAHTCPGVHTHRHTNECQVSNPTSEAAFKSASLLALGINPRERGTQPLRTPLGTSPLHLFCILSCSSLVPKARYGGGAWSRLTRGESSPRPQKQGEGKLLPKSLEHSDSPKRLSGEMICQKRFPRLSSLCSRFAYRFSAQRAEQRESPAHFSTVAVEVAVPSKGQRRPVSAPPQGSTGGIRAWAGMRKESQRTLRSPQQDRREDAPLCGID